MRGNEKGGASLAHIGCLAEKFLRKAAKLNARRPIFPGKFFSTGAPEWNLCDENDSR
jgi:hypothetical protein